MEWIARCSLARGPSPPPRKERKKIREGERERRNRDRNGSEAMREEGRTVCVGGRSGFSGAEGDTEAWSSSYQQPQW